MITEIISKEAFEQLDAVIAKIKEVRAMFMDMMGLKYECIKELTIDHENGEYSTYYVPRTFSYKDIQNLSDDAIKEHFKIIQE
jgi:hypothetical protein